MSVDSDANFDYYQGIATSSFGDMLHDHERNEKFSLALKKAIDKVHGKGLKAHVLDIGTGTGLLSMLAVTHGADSVVACEMFQPVAECASRIIAANGFSDKIKLINKHSLDLTVGEDADLPHRANILVSEVFDTELIGEGAIATFNHAHSVLLESNSIVIPSVGTIYGQIVESPSLLRWHRLQEWSDNDVKLVDVPSAMKTCSGTPALFDFQLSQFPIGEFSPLTERIPLFKFDFMRCAKLPRLQYQRINTKVLKTGNAHAVFTWWDLIMDDEGEILLSCAPVWHHPDGPKVTPQGNPAVNIPWRDHWMQSAYFFRDVKNISSTTCTLRAWHDEFSYWFGLCLCERVGEDVCQCQAEQLPACDCSLHMIASRTRIAAMNCPKRRSALLQVAQDLVKRKKIFIISGDFSLLGFLLCKLGANYVFFINDDMTNVSKRVLDDFIKENQCDAISSLCNLETAAEKIRQLVEQQSDLKYEICFAAEPYYQSSILPWDNTKFLSALDGFLALTKDFLKKDHVLISPSYFEISACCVQFDDLWKISRPLKKCMGYDVEIFDELIARAKRMAVDSPEAQPLWEYPCKAISEPLTFFKWDAEDYGNPVQKAIHFRMRPTDSVDGIAFWINYNCTPGMRITTGPTENPQVGDYISWDRCERQGIHLFDSPQNATHVQFEFEYDVSAVSKMTFNFDQP